VEVADAPSVATVAADGFDTFFREIYGVVGKDTVEIEDDSVKGVGKVVDRVLAHG